jgi:photosystem II stability/assembly factor-like uncharacterized protein
MKRTVFLITSLVLLFTLISCNSHIPKDIQNPSSSLNTQSKSNPRNNIVSDNNSSQQIQNRSSSSSENRTNIYSISEVDFITSQIGYLCLNATDGFTQGIYTLFKTLDGGKQWAVIKNNSELCSVNFADKNIGYGLMATKDGFYNIVKTNDGGINWSYFSIGFLKNKNITALNVLSNNVIFVSCETQTGNGTVSHIFRSVDGGTTCTEIKLPTDNNKWLCDFNWISANQGYVLFHGQGFTGNEFKTLYYTSDDGKTWTIKSKSPSDSSMGNSSEEAATSIGNIGVGGTGGKIRFFFK